MAIPRYHCQMPRGVFEHKRSDPQERFWLHVDKNGPLNYDGTRCWIWMASTSPRGYGQFSTGTGTTGIAHRFSYKLVNGTIPLRPDGGPAFLDHRHTCPKTCVNPAHLRVVLTNKENQENRKGANRNSQSGVRGVIWDKRRGKWRADVQHNNKINFGGYFVGDPPPSPPPQEAIDAVIALRNRLFTHNDADR